MPKRADIVNQRFGRWTVINFYDVKQGNSRWVCKCDCGSIKIVSLCSLRKGESKSCGCLWQENHKKYGLKHGGCNTRLYQIWTDMKHRCNNPNESGYKYYGGKGIKVCEAWLNDFVAFRDWALSHGYRDDLTIDREDSNKDYYPENCRWITMKENMDRSRRHYEGTAINIKNNECERFDSLVEFARNHGFSPHSVQCAVKAGRDFKGWKITINNL